MNDIEEVKSRINIIDIVGQRVQLRKAGRNFKGLCPFHNEKTPSFMVSPERGSWHCFGCGKGGSAIDFVMEYEHVDFREALETLADKAGVTLERSPVDAKEAGIKDRIFQVNHMALEYYQYLLMSHSVGENARMYLKNRGVRDQTIKTFGLGYSANSWDGLRKFLLKKGYDDDLLEQAGLTIKSARGGYDRFRGRVMFALRDHRGRVVGFSGRLLDKEAKEAKYINTSETPVYSKSHMLYGLDVTKAAIQKANEAIIMEGEFDVISSFQEGIGNVVAIKGSALTEGHIQLLRRFCEKLTFALDSDLAGDMASRRGITLAEQAGLDIKAVVMPVGKDPDEAVRTDPVEFKKAISSAVPVFEYFLQSATKRFNIADPFGRKKFSEEMMPILASMENPVIQAFYVKQMSKILDVAENVIVSAMRKMGKTTLLPFELAKPAQPAATQKPRSEKLEFYTLAFILQTNARDYLDELKERVTFNDIKNPAVRRILGMLEEYLAQEQQFTVKGFANSLPAELHPVLDEAFLWDLSGFIDDPELTVREWMKTLRELRRSILREKIKQLTDEMKSDDAQTESQSAALTELTEELRALEKASTV